MTDRRTFVIMGVFASGQLCASLPHTIAGYTCSLCLSFLAGLVAHKLIRRWQSDETA